MEPQMPVSSPFDTAASMPQQAMPQPSFTQPTPPPAPAFALQMEAEPVTQVTSTTTTVQTVDTPTKKWIGYPIVGMITIVAWIVLVAEQYGLGAIIPYPLSGLIAGWLIILVGLWLFARGRLWRILAFWLWLAILVVVGGMIYDRLYPGTLPSAWSRGITVGYDYDQVAKSLTLTLGTLPFSWSDQVIVPPTPIDDVTIDALINDDDSTTATSGDVASLDGYTITVTGANTSWTKN